MTSAALQIFAGPVAKARLAERGLRAEDVGLIPAAAGGDSDHSGIDELTITGPSRISHLQNGEVRTYHMPFPGRHTAMSARLSPSKSAGTGTSPRDPAPHWTCKYCE